MFTRTPQEYQIGSGQARMIYDFPHGDLYLGLPLRQAGHYSDEKCEEQVLYSLQALVANTRLFLISYVLNAQEARAHYGKSE